MPWTIFSGDQLRMPEGSICSQSSAWMPSRERVFTAFEAARQMRWVDSEQAQLRPVGAYASERAAGTCEGAPAPKCINGGRNHKLGRVQRH